MPVWQLVQVLEQTCVSLLKVLEPLLGWMCLLHVDSNSVCVVSPLLVFAVNLGWRLLLNHAQQYTVQYLECL